MILRLHILSISKRADDYVKWLYANNNANKGLSGMRAASRYRDVRVHK